MDIFERRIAMIFFIYNCRHTNISSLAEKYMVSERTIKRDIDAIGYFVPLITKRGRYHGGIFIMDNYKLQLPIKKPAENKENKIW